ncbi:glycosyltransferase [Psychrobacillus sp. NPDC096623]|uniref:glycosyltransferase n=1 Tax=Psychrobacillus sp. NPDC096623 TaxID=3364492 RepID=UPI0038292C36
MKKILIMNDHIYGGGVEKVMMNLVNHLPIDKYKITILTNNYEQKFYDSYDETVDYWYINKKLIKGTSILVRACNKVLRKINNGKIKRLIKEEQFDIVIAIKEGPCMHFISDLDAPKKIAWVHTDYDVLHWTKGFFKEGQELNVMKKFNYIVCVSNKVKESVIKNVGDLGNLIFRANPLDEKYIQEKSKEEAIIDNLDHSPLFMSVGRLCKEKGFDMLLNVCQKLNINNYKYSLYIIGDGEYRELLENYIDQNQLNNVKLLGLKNNPYKYLKHADWFISASRAEGYALVTQEAAILGIPIIATDCSGVKELLGEDNKYGIVTEINEDSIYTAMAEVIENKNMQTYYKEKIIERSKIISISQRMKDIEALF